MKKLKFGLAGLLFASLVAVTAVNVNLKYGAEKGNSDLILTNVEALAQGEGGLSPCAESRNETCTIGGQFYQGYANQAYAK